MSLLRTLMSKAGAMLGGKAGDPDDILITLPEDDPEMRAAFEAARASIEVFSRANDENDGRNSHFAVKIGCRTKHGGVEHIWVGIVGSAETGFEGVVLNEPVDLRYRGGDKIVFDAEEIGDWSYLRDGKAYGQFTTRVLCERAPEVEAQRMMAGLWPTPLPPESH